MRNVEYNTVYQLSKQLVVVLGVFVVGAGAHAADLGTQEQQASGKLLYEKHCAQCHGVAGDAVAPAAPYFNPAPRDFTSGKYKVRFTGSGDLPLDADIASAIKKGLAFAGHGAYTVMPPWPNFSDTELNNLVYYLKSFSDDFNDPEYNDPKPVVIPKAPAYTEEWAKAGRAVFESNECIKCHGQVGRSDGPSAPTLKDDWDFHIRPADLSKRWTYRGGGTREDIYRTVTTGFNGTPMPAYGDTISEEDRWHLVNYLYSLSSRDLPQYNKTSQPIVVKPVTADIDLSDVAKAREVFSAAPESYIALAGQVIEPGRKLSLAANEVVVQAVYNKKEVAVMIRWNDMLADTGAENGPGLEAPLFVPPVAAVEEAGEDDDPFADDEEEEEDPFADDEEESDTSGAPVSKFSDAVSLQLPKQAQEGFAKPYFVFGDKKRAVDLWFQDCAKDAPQLFVGKGSSSLSPVEGYPLESVKQFEQGEWTVIFKRPLEQEGSMSFTEGSMLPVSFSLWDGFDEDRGNKRALTPWYSFYVEPMKKQSAILPMVLYGGGLFLAQLCLLWFVNRKYSL